MPLILPGPQVGAQFDRPAGSRAPEQDQQLAAAKGRELDVPVIEVVQDEVRYLGAERDPDRGEDAEPLIEERVNVAASTDRRAVDQTVAGEQHRARGAVRVVRAIRLPAAVEQHEPEPVLGRLRPDLLPATAANRGHLELSPSLAL